MVTKSTTTKPAKAKAPAKPRAPRAKKEAPAPVHEPIHNEVSEVKPKLEKPKTSLNGKYIFATGRRKTSIANVRLFEGEGDNTVNHKKLNGYFDYEHFALEALKPFDVTGLGKDFHFIAHVSGGGSHAQATAVSHGLAQALGKTSEEVRVVLKKNGLLTRDDRKKERKKPGLKRARRSPQWAKR
jgi:small subunit ribosomal protein S9